MVIGESTIYCEKIDFLREPYTINFVLVLNNDHALSGYNEIHPFLQ